MRRVLAMTALLVLGACDQPLPDGSAPALQRSATCRASLSNTETGISGAPRQRLTVKSDGGWCSINMTLSSDIDARQRGEAFVAVSPPAQGELDIVRMVSGTRVSYRAKSGYVGADTFTVRGVESGIVRNLEIEVVR